MQLEAFPAAADLAPGAKLAAEAALVPATAPGAAPGAVPAVIGWHPTEEMVEEMAMEERQVLDSPLSQLDGEGLALRKVRPSEPVPGKPAQDRQQRPAAVRRLWPAAPLLE